MVEGAVEQGQWAVLCVHGVGGQHLAISTGAFGVLVDHLARERDRIWTRPVLDVGRHTIRKRKELRIAAP